MCRVILLVTIRLRSCLNPAAAEPVRNVPVAPAHDGSRPGDEFSAEHLDRVEALSLAWPQARWRGSSRKVGCR